MELVCGNLQEIIRRENANIVLAYKNANSILLYINLFDVRQIVIIYNKSKTMIVLELLCGNVGELCKNQLQIKNKNNKIKTGLLSEII